jgi:5'-3' exonuclease
VYGRLEHIPPDPTDWSVNVRGAAVLAANLAAHREDAFLFRTLATLRTDVPLEETVDDLAWRGADGAALSQCARALEDDALIARAESLATGRGR